ncbi:MAG: DinB family protein [Phycisphaerales bacterium]
MSNPLSSNPLDVLLRHDHWGTRRVLEVCGELAPEQFQRRFDMGPGSLHETLTHVVGAMRRWCDRLLQRPIRPAVDNPPRNVGMPSDYRVRTPGEIIALLDEAGAELVSIAADVRRPGGLGLESEITFALDGTTYRTTRGAAFVHVTTHGTHHRAQCLNMLRQLGVTRLPELTVIDWQSEVETRKVEPFARRNVLATRGAHSAATEQGV